MSQQVKVVVTVPEAEADTLREVIGRAGGGQIGNYSFCSFSVKGTGRFVPNDQANPTIGQANQLEQVAEERIEITCNRTVAKQAIAAIRAAHSYEEPAIDIYPLLEESGL